MYKLSRLSTVKLTASARIAFINLYAVSRCAMQWLHAKKININIKTRITNSLQFYAADLYMTSILHPFR